MKYSHKIMEKQKSYEKDHLQANQQTSVKPIKWCFLGFIVFTVAVISVISLVQHNYVDQVIYIDASLRPQKVNEKFLSLALDSSVAADHFKNFNLTSFKLIKLIKHLTPCYLRLGGTLADKLLFVPVDDETNFKEVPLLDECDIDGCFSTVPNYTLSGSQWLKFNKFIQHTGASLIFDLNVLIRNPDGSWNSSNAEELIQFSSLNNLRLDWELGNEPNSFFHVFNEAVNASQLAKDYYTLRKILSKNDLYKNSLLIGPSITRIRTLDISQYFRTFLQGAAKVVSSITWHHYYFNGRNATSSEFLDPKVFDLLKLHINRIQRVIKDLTIQYKPLWLGETSSAWGGGAPNMSNRFLDTFIWIDKLGLAAKMGVSVVIRQTIFKGYYALLDDNYDPNPDYWVAIIYKQLVDTTVLPSLVSYDSKVRLYAHCAKRNFYNSEAIGPSLVVFGLNVDETPKTIQIDGVQFQPLVKAFELTAGEGSLLSQNVLLNGKILQLADNYDLPKLVPKIVNLKKTHLTMPPYSVCFWLLESNSFKFCNKPNTLYAV